MTDFLLDIFCFDDSYFENAIIPKITIEKATCFESLCDIPFEIYQKISSYQNCVDQIKITTLCRYFYHHIRITDFYNLDEKYLKNLSDKILKRYPYIEQLNASNNPKIKDINHLKKIKKLNASGHLCGITNDGITDLNLISLYVTNNIKITKPCHMSNLNNFIGNTRYFKCKYGDSDPFGRFSGLKPKHAANKAFTYLIKQINHIGNDPLRFNIVECTRGSSHKVYNYIGNVIKLDEPIKVTIGDRQIEYHYQNRIKKYKDPIN